MININILHRYLVKELLRTFIPAILCLEFLLVLGFSIQLLHKGLDVPSLFSVLPYMALYTIPHALPASLLTSTVMTYGRLSADNEITAIKVAGMHLHNIVTPIVVTGVIFSILTLYLNAEVLPRSYFKVRQLQEKAVKRVLATHFITAKKKIDFHPYQIYITSIEDGIYRDIAVFEYADEYIVNILLAEEGEIEVGESGSRILLTLRRGEFLKPDINSIDSPKMGNFEEAVFEIPLRQRVRHKALKYATLTSLITQRGEIDDELSGSGKLLKDPEKTIKVTWREVAARDEKMKVVQGKLQRAEVEMKKSKARIPKQEGVKKRAKFDVSVFENYINVARNNIRKLTLEREVEEDMKMLGFDLRSEEEFEKNVSLIEKIIEKEKRRIKKAKRKVSIAERAIENENKKIEEVGLEIEGLLRSKEDLRKERLVLIERVGIAERQKMSRELSVNIHKRISPSLASLTFIMIGIPLGIMTRSSNMLISLGISFVLILFVYYPLVATGLVLADSMNFPIIPSVWAANVVNIILGVFLFRKILIE
ncbi:MAG: LptF/LptG family permease [Candidatus Pacebacteria bacterium]|nr:LptF/LptG family permease [Candidatus Paceibacterota bacterium]